MSGGGSAGGQLAMALWAWLKADADLADCPMFDAPPVRATLPFAMIEEPVLQQRDLAGMTGRVGTVAVQLFDDGERPLRLRSQLALVEDDLARMPADLGAGWRLAALSLRQSRVAKGKAGWSARTEWAVRMYRADA